MHLAETYMSCDEILYIVVARQCQQNGVARSSTIRTHSLRTHKGSFPGPDEILSFRYIYLNSLRTYSISTCQ